MIKKDISGGVVHQLPKDLEKALTADPKVIAIWESLTPWPEMNGFAGQPLLKKKKQGKIM